MQPLALLAALALALAKPSYSAPGAPAAPAPSAVAIARAVKTGDPAPAFDAEFLHVEATSSADFAGEVLLIEFFRTGSKPCAADIARLDELAALHRARGLAVLAVTSEPKKTVVDALAGEPRAHPVAIVKGDEVEKLFGVLSTPHALLVDVHGRIAWTGTLGELDPKELEELLLDVVPPVDPKHADASKALRRQQYDKGVEAIDRALVTAPDDARLLATKAAIDRVLARRLEQAQAALATQKYAEAADRYARIDAAFGLLPAAAPARAARTAIEKDPAAKDDLAAWKLHERAQAKAVAGDDDKAVLEWQALIKKYPATKTAERAKIALRQRGR